MARPKDVRVHQSPGVCTGCGHGPHDRRQCAELIKVAAGPSGGPGRQTPTKMIICPCWRKR